MRIAFCNGIANDLDNRDHQDQNHHGNVDDVHPVPLLPVNIGVVAQASAPTAPAMAVSPIKLISVIVVPRAIPAMLSRQ